MSCETIITTPTPAALPGASPPTHIDEVVGRLPRDAQGQLLDEHVIVRPAHVHHNDGFEAVLWAVEFRFDERPIVIQFRFQRSFDHGERGFAQILLEAVHDDGRHHHHGHRVVPSRRLPAPQVQGL